MRDAAAKRLTICVRREKIGRNQECRRDTTASPRLTCGCGVFDVRRGEERVAMTCSVRRRVGRVLMVVLAALGAAGCGSAGESRTRTREAVPAYAVRVDGAVVSPEAVARQKASRALREYAAEPDAKWPVPDGVLPDPPLFARCSAFLVHRATTGRGEGATAKAACEQKERRISAAAAEELAQRLWVEAEAKRLGIAASEEEIARQLRAGRESAHIAPHSYPAYLKRLGETLGDARATARESVLVAKMVADIERHYGPKALEAFLSGFKQRWSRVTQCSPGYAFSGCAVVGRS